jgi:hypothetical protein
LGDAVPRCRPDWQQFFARQENGGIVQGIVDTLATENLWLLAIPFIYLLFSLTYHLETGINISRKRSKYIKILIFVILSLSPLNSKVKCNSSQIKNIF